MTRSIRRLTQKAGAKTLPQERPLLACPGYESGFESDTVSICLMISGDIFDIKKYAIHDGPGIRTTIFFKGCPLSCWWCHNPEGIKRSPERLFRQDRCIGCQLCIQICPHKAIANSATGPQWIPSNCQSCQTCAQMCPTEAVQFVGKVMSVDEVMAEISRDTVFYDESNGGVTISGGEPLMQPQFLLKLLDACGDLDLHRTVDTSGHAETKTLLQVAACTDLFLYDLKHMDPAKHLYYTGVSNEMILQNLKRLSDLGAEIIVRLPIIPGINSDDENIDRTGAFVSRLAGIRSVNLLPYHCAAVTKYANLGTQYQMVDIVRPSRDQLESMARRLEKYDIEAKIGG
jgi:pyruvate formate lyase activating enzyme